MPLQNRIGAHPSDEFCTNAFLKKHIGDHEVWFLLLHFSECVMRIGIRANEILILQNDFKNIPRLLMVIDYRNYWNLQETSLCATSPRLRMN